jgi:hypothetical protein
MKSIIKFGITILVISLLATGCGISNSVANNPKDLVGAYINYLNDGNYKAAAKLMSSEAKKDTSKDSFTEAKEKLISFYGQDVFSKITVTLASESEKEAKVLVKLNGMNQEDLTFNLVKESNNWKIVK